MNYIIAGDRTLHCLKVAFHLLRENSYSPWDLIGVVVGFGNRADCYYKAGHRHIDEEFQLEAERAGTLSGSYEFINSWHLRYQRRNDVVTKVINYYVTKESLVKFVRDTAYSYVVSNDPNRFIRLAIMLRSRERYIPVVFNPAQRKLRALNQKIIEANQI
jgi:hypothetical protein